MSKIVFNPHWLALFVGIVVTSFSQVLLKRGVSAKKSIITSFANSQTIASYLLFAVVTVLNVYAMQEIQLRTMTAWAGASYVIVAAFSKVFLNERIDLPRVGGCLLILMGITVFSL